MAPENATPKTEQPIYRYYVGWFNATERGTLTYGGIDLNRPQPIRTAEDVNGVTGKLREHLGLPKLAVTGFSLYAD